jgi:ADP-ribose pyrophosphatase
MLYELIHSDIVYPGRAFTIRRDHLLLPDGRETNLDIVEHVGSVVILPIDDAENILFVRQYRHAAGLELLELPAGTLDPDEHPEACARREIREETGMAAGKIQSLGGFYLAPGYSTEYMHVYLATDLHFDPLEADADEFLSVEKIPLREAKEMDFSARLPDAKSLAAFYLARPFLMKYMQHSS